MGLGWHYDINIMHRYKDIHDGPMICIGNGPSLLNVPTDFLGMYPSIGMNWVVHYNHLIDDFVPNYWVALDGGPLVEIPDIPTCFVRRKYSKSIKGDNLVFFDPQDLDGPDGLGHSTTMVAAVQIALYMGASDVLIVGFDCTKGYRGDALPEYGKNGTRHFYDLENGSQTSVKWDKDVGKLASWAESTGRAVWNLSPFTMASRVPRAEVTEWAGD